MGVVARRASPRAQQRACAGLARFRAALLRRRRVARDERRDRGRHLRAYRQRVLWRRQRRAREHPRRDRRRLSDARLLARSCVAAYASRNCGTARAGAVILVTRRREADAALAEAFVRERVW